jgi:hypothetical protein
LASEKRQKGKASATTGGAPGRGKRYASEDPAIVK